MFFEVTEAMVSPSDSTAVFVARLKELDLFDLHAKFKEKGWDTFANFAFATTSFRDPDPEAFAKEVLTHG